jgi:hypothetical protein
MQTVEMERWLPFKFLTSLLRFGSGWFANHALQRTRHGVAVCNRCVLCAEIIQVNTDPGTNGVRSASAVRLAMVTREISASASCVRNA